MFRKSNQNPETSKELFIKTVMEFEKAHNTSLEEIFANYRDYVEQKKENPLIEEFLSHPIIHSYLTREASKLLWENAHPKLIDAKNDMEKTETDYYEIKPY